MRLQKGPRPWPVTAFVGIMGAVACWNFGVDIQRALAEPVEAERIIFVSRASAALLIHIIPAAAIWLFASRIARWLMTIASIMLAVYRVALLLPAGLPDAESAHRLLAGFFMNALVLLLFAPSARRWFAQRQPDDPIHGS